MKDSSRRMILMLTIVIVGSALIFLDVSTEVLIAGTIAIGLISLIGLGILSFLDIKESLRRFFWTIRHPVSILRRKGKSEKEAKKETKQQIKQQGQESLKKAEPDEVEEKTAKKRFSFPSIKGTPSRIKNTLFTIGRSFKKEKNAPEKTEKINSLLDKTISEPIDGESPIEMEDFDEFDFGEEEMEGFDLSESGQNVTGHPGTENLEPEITDSQIADILANEEASSGIDLNIEGSDFPEFTSEDSVSSEENGGISNSGIVDLGELSDLSNIEFEDEDLDHLDELSLDDIEPDTEPDEFPEEIEIENVEIGESVKDANQASDDIDAFAAPPDEWSQTSSINPDELDSDEEISFGPDGGDENDLFAMLKSDTKKVVSVQEESLVRELKDVHVEAGELVEGLESILNKLENKSLTEKRK
ncbi:MAG: hypothetical protein KAW93_05370 [Methanogenium sp.]|nr:hypothetical protein [Methanogenium sp.]